MMQNIASLKMLFHKMLAITQMLIFVLAFNYFTYLYCLESFKNMSNKQVHHNSIQNNSTSYLNESYLNETLKHSQELCNPKYCMNHGMCFRFARHPLFKASFPYDLVQFAPRKECLCSRGWKGKRCHLDDNECSDTSVCAPQSNCINTIGSYKCIETKQTKKKLNRTLPSLLRKIRQQDVMHEKGNSDLIHGSRETKEENGEKKGRSKVILLILVVVIILLALVACCLMFRKKLPATRTIYTLWVLKQKSNAEGVPLITEEQAAKEDEKKKESPSKTEEKDSKNPKEKEKDTKEDKEPEKDEEKADDKSKSKRKKKKGKK